VTSQSHAVSTWPPPGAQEAVASADRPHTISSAYERGHQRPALTVYTFQNPGETITESTSQKSPATSLSCRPPLPIVNVLFLSFYCTFCFFPFILGLNARCKEQLLAFFSLTTEHLSLTKQFSFLFLLSPSNSAARP
jgi:hypothetical protein